MKRMLIFLKGSNIYEANEWRKILHYKILDMTDERKSFEARDSSLPAKK